MVTFGSVPSWGASGLDSTPTWALEWTEHRVVLRGQGHFLPVAWASLRR